MSYDDEDRWDRWAAGGGQWDDTTMRPPTVGPGPSWTGYEVYEQPRSRGCLAAALVGVVVSVLLVVVAVVAYVLMRDGGDRGAAGGADRDGMPTGAWTTGSAAPTDGVAGGDGSAGTAGGDGSAGATGDPGGPATGSPPQRGPSSASEASIPAGADRSGWLSVSGARCNAGDPAYLIGATTTAAFSICQNPDNGRYYYRGAAEAGTIEIADPVLGAGTATVYNKGHVYEISSAGMVITNGGVVIFDEPMTSYWVR